MKIFIFFLILLPTSLFAAADIRGRLSITPIVGVERVQKFYPTAHMKTRTIFGARAIYKFPISALEVEYTHGQDTENQVSTNTTYKDSEDKLRIGLRGSFSLGSFISTYLRGGAQARKNEHTSTVNNTSSVTVTSSKIQPYVGTGIDFKILTYFSLTADILATFTPTNDPNLKDFELQPSLGVSLKF
jgi:hypothetical protein